MMFGKKVEKTRSDWPKDKVFADKGYVLITGDYPALRYVEGLIFTGLFLFVPSFLLIGPFALAVAPAGMLLARPIFRKTIKVRIGPDIIQLRGKSYTRDAPIEFRVETHHRAQLPEPGKYRRALEVIMQYGERRIVVAEMRQQDKEKAVSLIFRLQSWCDKFDDMMAHFSMQQGGAPQPAASGEFGPAPPVR